jgi:hypothetical protein
VFGPSACGASLPSWKHKLMGACWGLFWLPLFPQGLVAMFLKIFGPGERSWFLALYLPEVFQWPFIIGMIGLGLAMVIFAAQVTQQMKRLESGPNT